MSDLIRVRRAAAALRAVALDALARRGEASTPDALLAAAAESEQVDVILAAPGSRLLGTARAKLDRSRPAIIVDRTLADEARRFSTAHELGHLVVERDAPEHGEHHDAGCAADEVEEAPSAAPFPLGEAYVTGYGPRQRGEVHASLFAAEFLAPVASVCEAFRAGQSSQEIAAELGVSPTVVHGQLAAGLLHPLPVAEPGDDSAEPASAQPAAFALHPRQVDAQRALPGPIAVDAGPGTGKTRTLTERVTHLVRDRGVRPDQLLGLTFSNKAAAEMASRIARALGPRERRSVRVQTFHAFGLDLLRDYPDQAGVRNDVTLLDPADARDLLERHLSELRLEEYRHVTEPGLYLDAILDAITRAKDEMVGPERYAQLAAAAHEAAGDDRARKAARRAVEVARVYDAYERLLGERGAVDFGDLICRVVRLFEAHPEVAAAESARYPHILVDEYQDVNRASARLLQLLRPDGRGLWVVGDVRQAIYRFRGASPRNFRDFAADFPGAGSAMPLVRNYRSVPALLDVFSSVAKAMSHASGFADWEHARTDTAGPVVFGVARDEEAEVSAITDRILALHDEGRGRRFEDFAVLCHRNRDVQQIARACELRGIPVANFGDYFDRIEVRDLLAVLALAAGQSAALARVGQTAPHALPPEDLDALLTAVAGTRDGLAAVLNAGSPPDGMAPAAFATIRNDWAALSSAAYRREVWTFFAEYLFEDGRYLRRLALDTSYASRQRRFAIGQLLLLARAFDARHARAEAEASAPAEPAVVGMARKRAFLHFVRRLWASKDRRVAVPLGDGDAVFVGTVHSSKGLEFPVVFVPFLAEGRFPFDPPHDHAPPPAGLVEQPDEAGEEAELEALFFVALTRARDGIVLSHALDYGGAKAAVPSRLLRLVEPARAAGLFTEEQWAGTGAGRAAAGHALLRPHTPTTLTYNAYTTYLDCPRRYFYRHVLGLPEADDGRAYLAYVSACRKTLDWIVDRHREGALTRDWEVVKQAFDAHWAAGGPVGHVHDAFYREEALGFVRADWDRRHAMAPAAAWETEAVLAVDNVRLRIPVEATRHDGERVHVAHRFFRPRKPKEDHLEPRFALLRAAMAQAAAGPVVVEAHYREQVVDLPPLQKRHEQKRLDDCRAALAAIGAGAFPAEPSEERERACPRCPYAFVCPL